MAHSPQQSYSGPSAGSLPAPSMDSSYFDASGGGGSSLTYEREEQELLRMQIDVSDLLDDFEHKVLRGEFKRISSHSGAEEWVKYDSINKPIINELGVREILGRIIGKVSKAARLTYKTEEEIYKDMFYFDMSITELVAKRCDIWEMDVETAKAIKDAAVELVWDIAASSRNGFTAVNLRSQYSRSDVTRTDSTQRDAKSFLGIPLGKR